MLIRIKTRNSIFESLSNTIEIGRYYVKDIYKDFKKENFIVGSKNLKNKKVNWVIVL